MDRAASLPELPPGDAGAPAVKLGVFEGPLDLLLHLIRLNEVDVTDIPISEIAQQYVEYLGLMHELNLDVAGEYLLMAATLAWIKSRLLLPSLEAEDEDGLDPRAELVARLLEYQRFKEVAGELGERPLLERDVFAAHGAELDATPEGEREIEVGLFALLEAWRRVTTQARAAAAVHEVETETITVRERMLALIERLQGREALEFEECFATQSGGAPSRTFLITTFLALLELARIGAVRLYQGLDDAGSPRGPIRLRRAPDSEHMDFSAELAEVM